MFSIVFCLTLWIIMCGEGERGWGCSGPARCNGAQGVCLGSCGGKEGLMACPMVFICRHLKASEIAYYTCWAAWRTVLYIYLYISIYLFISLNILP